MEGAPLALPPFLDLLAAAAVANEAPADGLACSRPRSLRAPSHAEWTHGSRVLLLNWAWDSCASHATSARLSRPGSSRAGLKSADMAGGWGVLPPSWQQG